MGSPHSGWGKSLKALNVRELDSRLSRNWYLLLIMTVTSTIGFALAIAPFLTEQMGAVWPWPQTNLVLLGGLVVSVLLLIVQLTHQQLRFGEVRGAVRTLEAESIERERHSHARLNALLNISGLMGSITNLADLYKNVMETCVEMFKAHQASLMLVDGSTNELVVCIATGHLEPEKVRKARQKIGEGVAGWVAERRKPILLGPGAPLSQYPGLNINIAEMTAAIVAPVLLRDELVGVLSVRSRDAGDRYNENDLQALRVLAENIGTVIRHSQHVEWMSKTIEASRAKPRETPVR
jgi:transcriptional regulator with GAF, ATPase, and Fis domain